MTHRQTFREIKCTSSSSRIRSSSLRNLLLPTLTLTRVRQFCKLLQRLPSQHERINRRRKRTSLGSPPPPPTPCTASTRSFLFPFNLLPFLPPFPALFLPPPLLPSRISRRGSPRRRRRPRTPLVLPRAYPHLRPDPQPPKPTTHLPSPGRPPFYFNAKTHVRHCAHARE